MIWNVGGAHLLFLLTTISALDAAEIISGHKLYIYGIELFWILLGTYLILDTLSRKFNWTSLALPFPVVVSGRAKIFGSSWTAFDDGNLVDAAYRILRPMPDALPFEPFVETRIFDPDHPGCFTDNMRAEFYGGMLIFSSWIEEENPPNSFTILQYPLGNPKLEKQKIRRSWQITATESGAIVRLRETFWGIPFVQALNLYLTGHAEHLCELAASVIDNRPDRSIFTELQDKFDRRATGNQAESEDSDHEHTNRPG